MPETASYKKNAESCDMYQHTFLSQKLRNIILGTCIDFLAEIHVLLNKTCLVIGFCSAYFEFTS
jgi:hypothetical protein